jgi:hypothetical protein
MPSANDDADDESESDDSKADDDVDEVLIDKR